LGQARGIGQRVGLVWSQRQHAGRDLAAAALADWHVAVAQHFADAGAPLGYMTVNNEPDFCPIPGNPTPYFLDHATFAQFVKVLGAKLEAAGLATRLVVTDGVTPESSLPYFHAVLDDDTARKYVGAIAFHSYDGYQDPKNLDDSVAGHPTGEDTRRQVRELGQRYSLPIWMTEVTARNRCAATSSSRACAAITSSTN
jgi:O-glycosyl hydrolase